MKKRVLIVTFIISFILPVCAQSYLNSKQVLATVGNYKITLGQYTDRYEDYLVYSGVQDNKQLRFSILNNMINEILLYNYDNNSKIFNNPEYKKEIKWAKKETILAFLKDREIYSHITASDSEVREAYRRSQIKLAVRHLYAPTLQAAENLYHLLKIGVDFKELAKQVFTDSVLKNNGGYLGYISWGQTDPNFEKVAYSLKIGEISKPVKTAQGYSIIRVDDKIVNPIITETEYQNMKRKIARGVKIDKKVPAEKAYLHKIFGKNEIKFNDKAIADVFRDLQNNQNNRDPEFNTNKNSDIKNCVVYNSRSYSQSEIENKLLQAPQYNLKKLTDTKKVQEAILALLMQKKLLEIAHQKGYDTTSYVLNTIKKLDNNIYLNYKRNEIIGKIDVPDSELYSYYNKNIGYFKSENEMNVQEIILDNNATAGKVMKLLNKGGNFGELAEKYSIRKWTAKNSGELGLSPVSKYGEMKDTLWNSTIGETIGPLKFKNYYGIFRVIKKEEGKPISFDIVKPQILNAVRNEKGFPYMKKHIESLSKKVNIQVNDDLIKNFNLNLAG